MVQLGMGLGAEAQTLVGPVSALRELMGECCFPSSSHRESGSDSSFLCSLNQKRDMGEVKGSLETKRQNILWTGRKSKG